MRTKTKHGPGGSAKVFSETVHVIHILDCSGSMYNMHNTQVPFTGSKYAAAVELMNKELGDLPNNFSKFTFSLVEFGDWRRIYRRRWLSDELKPVSLNPTLGMTALNDAIGNTLKDLPLPTTDKYLISIFTDGGENDSHVYRYEAISELVRKFTDAGHTVTFIGTESDVLEAQHQYNVHLSNTLVHDNTAAGINSLSKTRKMSMASYSKAVADGVDVSVGFYKEAN